MNIKKLAAITLATVTAGATLGTVAFGQISSYVSLSDGTLTSPMVVIGSRAGDAVNYPKDVVAAADIAAHVAGYATKDVAVSGVGKTFTSTAENKEVATTSTKIFLDNSLGKSGLRSTMTNTDLSTLLATGTVVDKNSTSIKYDQFLFLTPSSTSSASYTLQFERPSSSSAEDGMYSFGRLSTTPSATEYFLNYRLNFRKGADSSALVGKTITIAGDTYTILSDSVSSVGTVKLVGTKAAASQSILVSDGDVQVTVGSNTYTVKVIGTSDASTVVVSVNGVSQSATKGKTTNINGVDVYVDDVFHFANNQESSGGKLLIGATKVIFQDGSKIKLGTNEDNVEGTLVSFTTSSGKFDTMNVYLAGPASSVTDNLKMGNWYKLPSFDKLALFFPGISTGLTDESDRNVLKITGSGDNNLQLNWKDRAGATNTFVWAYRTGAGTGQTAFSLADSNGNVIHVVEGENMTQDQHMVLDAGDFPHLVQLTGIDSNGLSFTLKDVFTGESTKYDLAVSNNGQKTIYIDGQAYYAQFNKANTSVGLTWGDGANFNNTVGDAVTVWPTLKGFKGERLALLSVNVTINASTNSVSGLIGTQGTELQLPTGAVNITIDRLAGHINLTAITDEDGETSACTTTPCVNSFPQNGSTGSSASFVLGKTSTAGAGANYTIMSMGTDGGLINLTFSGSTDLTRPISQPGLFLYEEKDDSSNRYGVLVTASYEGTSTLSAIPAAPKFTYYTGGTTTETTSGRSQARGTDTTITDYVDLFGVYAMRTTSGQDTLTIYYPDEQVYAVIGAGDASGTASIGGAAGGTVKSAVVITSPVAKLDNEINTASLTSDLVLVGGPCANTLVAKLAEDNATGVPSCSAWNLNTGLIKEVSNAFSSGRKALVIAGTSADDTRSLAAKVMSEGTLSYQA